MAKCNQCGANVGRGDYVCLGCGTADPGVPLQRETGLGGFVVILSAVGLISSVCSFRQLSTVLPIWEAVVVALLPAAALVWCFTVGGDTDFFDLLIASAVILILVGFFLPAEIIHRHDKKQRNLPSQTEKLKAARHYLFYWPNRG
jgi:hypothetical protein